MEWGYVSWLNWKLRIFGDSSLAISQFPAVLHQHVHIFFAGKIYNCFCWHFNQTNIFKFCGRHCLIKEETRATFSGFQLEHTEAIKEESNVMNVCSGFRISHKKTMFLFLFGISHASHAKPAPLRTTTKPLWRPCLSGAPNP